ncbi:MAG: S41 family peptidase [Defluviitaleaceae bacterium]|nr:S41 family peptidase [Defluviitaleaceae bacterium]
MQTVSKKNRITKILKIAAIAAVALVILLVAAFLIVWNMSGRPSLNSANVAHNRTMDFTNIEMNPPSFATDALYLVRLIEQTHPTFIIDGWLSDDYEIIRAQFLEYTQNENLTRLDFAFAVARFITVFGDGHMSGQGVLIEQNESGMWQPAIFGNLLDVPWGIVNSNLHLRNESGELTNTIVTEIGGMPVSHIFEIIDQYFHAENDAERYHNHAVFTRFGDIIVRAGGQIVDDAVMLTLYSYGVSSEELYRIEPPQPSGGLDFIVNYEMMDDIFFIDLRTFFDGSHITELVQAIEDAVAAGTQNFIIDLRGNGGGASVVGERILEAMGITVPRYGSARRISRRMISYSGMFPLHILRWLGIDYLQIEPYIPTNNNTNNVFVSILTNSGTYSSATMMGVWVQDGGFGNVVGSASRNAPTSFGDILSFTLPYSGYIGRVSHVLWNRPDTNADQHTLMPDILVDPSDALEAALEFLRNMQID